MFKKMCLIGVCFAAIPVMAQTVCANGSGTLFHGSTSGTYCISNIQLNWWSAHSWCRAAGGSLATTSQACAGRFDQCPNLAGATADYSLAWTADPEGNKDATYIDLATGRFRTKGGEERKSQKQAICIMP